MDEIENKSPVYAYQKAMESARKTLLVTVDREVDKAIKASGLTEPEASCTKTMTGIRIRLWLMKEYLRMRDTEMTWLEQDGDSFLSKSLPGSMFASPHAIPFGTFSSPEDMEWLG